VSDSNRIELNYFEARGRAQCMRYYFACRAVDYVDRRVSTDLAREWPSVRTDRTFAGPFHKLPVLRYGERAVAETLVILAFLYRERGDDALLTDDERLQHQTVISSLYGDVVTPIAVLLYCELMFAGCDLKVVATRTFERLGAHLRALDRALEEWAWCEAMARRPAMLADCLLYEELSVARTVFGARLDLAALPQLARFDREFSGSAACERVLAAHPGCPITARPAEADTIARIQAALAS
jgi:hypothetical protein